MSSFTFSPSLPHLGGIDSSPSHTPPQRNAEQAPTPGSAPVTGNPPRNSGSAMMLRLRDEMRRTAPTDHDLPKDIETLFSLADTNSFELPPWLEEIARAHGFAGLKFPCQAIASMMGKAATYSELEKRLHAFDTFLEPTHMEKHSLEGIRYFIVACLMMNIYSAASLLRQSAQHARIDAGLMLAKEIASFFIHKKVYDDISKVQALHADISHIHSILPKTDPAGRTIDNAILAQTVRNKLTSLRNEVTSSHVAEVFCSLLTYAAAYYIFHLGLESSASRR